MLNLDLPKDRNLFFTKQVDQASISELTQKIIDINEDDKRLKKLYKVYDMKYKPNPIKIYIDSYGGSAYQCFGLLGVMKKSKTPIHKL
jgi:ATP-dependent Clp protease, protease subunit